MMWDNDDEVILKKACIHYGKKNQRIKAMEELAELIQAIAKNNKNNITEEIADVLIMIRQMKICYDIQIADINGFAIEKIKRLRLRMEDE